MCQMQIPEVKVSADITNKDSSTLFDIKWHFDKTFVDTLSIYDVNKNGKFEPEEKKELKGILVDYIKEFNYLTRVEYGQKGKKFYSHRSNTIKPFEDKLYFKDQDMFYSYSFELDFKLQKDHKIYLAFEDMNGNFKFKIKDLNLKNYEGLKYYEPKLSDAFIRFYKKTALENDKIVEKSQQQSLLKPALKQEPANGDDAGIFIEYLSQQLKLIKIEIETLLKDIKENNSLVSYFWLLLFSFIYGVVHAIGPGHGKTLVGTYFLSEDRSYAKAFSIASLIGIVHTFSAFLLTLFIYNFIGFLFKDTLVDTESAATKLSALLIISIALYLIYKKVKPSKTTTMSFQTAPKLSGIAVSSPKQIHTQSLSCGCNACKTTSSDLWVVLAAGIVPCPGTVTIFIFTFGLGIYFIGFLSAVFMSMGMGLIIFLTALLSTKVRKRTSKNTKLIKTLEYGSLVFILFLGVVLLIV